MTLRNKATRIRLADFSSAPMRAFHMSWLAFFLCFFGWFGVAPLMPVIRQELHLTKAQIGNLTIASVAIAVLVRLVIGWLCDHIGPRRAYTWLLILGSLPVMAVGLAHDYTTFLIFRLAIGAIGASFVITQYHTSVMFAPNIVGTANAAAAGWGNLGGGVTQMVMPLLFSGLVALGSGTWLGWRLAMVVPGAMMLLTGIAYYKLTRDTADGDFAELRAKGQLPIRSGANGAFAAACRDPRVWALFVIYGACFGMELTVDNIAALYFTDYFHLALTAAGLVAGSFGMMNLFARALGGIVSDRVYRKGGLRGRALLLGGTICAEGFALMLFSQMRVLPLAIGAMMLAGLFIKMSNGATYSLVPFVNKRALGAVAGIVGAGGNVGSVLAGFLFKGSMPWTQALFVLGATICAVSVLAFVVRFSEGEERAAQAEIDARLAGEFAAAAAMGD
ncbi:MAG TPA: MFS transporter [Bryobacteraceae bacterium]|nr:MFS transporter [Bryobacteraceae bacterium]